MHVNVQRKEVGWFKKRIRVLISVTFTEEEKAIIKARRLQSHWVWEGTINGISSGCSLGSLVKGRVWQVDAHTPLEAGGWETEFTEGLQRTKAIIEGNKQSKPDSSSFEI